MLTACRSGEARLAHWAEIDMDNKLWTIPGERMKNRREHRQPLSDQAVAVITAMQENADGSDFVFPSPAKKGKSSLI